MKKALFVIDMQNVCVGENHAKFFKYNWKDLIENINEQIKTYDKENVFYIVNIMKNNIINKLAPFKAFEGTENVKLAKELHVVSDKIFKKYKGDAFTNKDLSQALNAMGIKQIEVVGVDGGGCVGLTALGAIENGYNVIVNTHAIGTMFDKKAEKLNHKLKKQGAQFI